MPKWRNLPKHLQVNRWVDVAADFDLHSIILLLPFSCWGLTFRPHLPLLRNSCLSARPTWLLSKMTLNTASWYFKPQQYSKATNSCRYIIKQKMHFWTGTWEWNKRLNNCWCVCFVGCWVFFAASPDQKEWAGQTKKGGQGAVAERAKEDGELIDVKVAFCRGPHTSECRI